MAITKWTNVICETRNKSLVIVDQCRLRALSRNKTILNIGVELLHPVRNLYINWKLYKRENGYKPWLGQYTVDYCAFMRRVNHPVIKLLYDIIQDFTNLNHTCPFVGKIVVKDFFWDTTNYTLPAPTGDYLLLLTWISNKKKQLLTSIYFSFKQDIFTE
ncbi:uncharacterized protein LOC135429800 [Drosophila montana]|uniref:uncharacterized protein LOC135429800 n=1 Tax=Drosophila montana TaxID=40370 RepID=UPI00313B2D41